MIVLRLDRVMADRKMSLNELAEKVGITSVNLSNIKTGKISAIRFSTLNGICKALDCQPGDILEYIEDGDDQGSGSGAERSATAAFRMPVRDRSGTNISHPMGHLSKNDKY